VQFRLARKPSLMLTLLHEDVVRRASAGEPLTRIEEELVDTAPLDEDRRSALWLYAWHQTEGTAQTRLVDSRL